MALDFFGGFDFVDVTELHKQWIQWNNGAAISATTAFSLGRSCQLTVSLNGIYRQRGVDGVLLATNTQRVLGFRLRLTGYPNAAMVFLCSTPNAAGSMINFGVQSTGEIFVNKGEAPMGGGTSTSISGSASANILALNTWYYIEICVTHHASAGTLEVFVNGSKTGWIDATGVNTSNGTGGGSNTIFLRGITAANGTLIDDMYLLGSTITRLGDCRVFSSIAQADSVSGAGDFNDSTPNTGSDRGANVDDGYGAPDRAGTFNTFTAAGQKDAYKHPALGVVGTVLGVNVHGHFSKSDAGTGSARVGLRSATTNQFGSTGFPAAGTYNYIGKQWEVSPFTSSPWTVSEVDATQLLAERVA